VQYSKAPLIDGDAAFFTNWMRRAWDGTALMHRLCRAVDEPGCNTTVSQHTGLFQHRESAHACVSRHRYRTLDSVGNWLPFTLWIATQMVRDSSSPAQYSNSGISTTFLLLIKSIMYE
jgi:hypothetical protein